MLAKKKKKSSKIESDAGKKERKYVFLPKWGIRKMMKLSARDDDHFCTVKCSGGPKKGKAGNKVE